MADTTRYTDLNTNNKLIDARFLSGKVRVAVDELTMASQAAGAHNTALHLPIGAVPLFGIVETSLTLGTATLAIGITGSTGKYRAAATFTATDTPTLFGVGAAIGEALTAAEDVILTTAVAALPASGTLRVFIFYSVE